jgi:hypothetical protein
VRSNRKVATKGRWNTLAITAAGIAAVVVAGLVIWFLVFSGAYASRADSLVFERDIAVDQGASLDPTKVLSTGTSRIRLNDLCSEELRNRWGADGQGEDGVGLTAVFVRKSGTRIISRDTVTIPSWQYADETALPDRRALVRDRCEALRAQSTAFMAPVSRKCVMAVVVDTTSGMNAILSRRAREVITDSSERLTGRTCGAGGFYAYRLTATPSQGDRWRVNRGPGFGAEMRGVESWLLESQPEQAESSVLRGLAASLVEISRLQPADIIRVDVFTDGLENVGDRSVYRDQTLLDGGNWPRLDVAWDPRSLQLRGFDIHLHPLPGQSDRTAALTARAFQYLKDRLERAGATVTIDTL